MKHLLLPAALALAAAALFFAPAGDAPAQAFSASASELPPPVANEAVWRPAPTLRWQLQFASSPVDTSVEADVYKIDLFDNPAEDIAALKEKHKKVVCYLNAGAWEKWRPDAKEFPAAAMGRAYEGWPGERWLDIRRIDLLAPIMLARLDLCRDKGFDGVMLDNVDSYTNKTGFPLTSADQLRFNVWMANEARTRGLAVGMNNNAAQARELAPYFDWVLAEGCLSAGWCGALGPFAAGGKPVVVIEYGDNRALLDRMCRLAARFHASLIVKRRELDAYRLDCNAVSRRASAT